MPLFERSADKSGVHVEAIHEVFKRGVRLDRDVVVRLQGQLYTVLATLGMDSTEISRVPTACSRQIRNVLYRDGETSSDEAMRRLALECALRGEHWTRRVRDAACGLLVAIGMDVEDVASVLRVHKRPVLVRQRIASLHPKVVSQASAGAWRVRREIEPLIPAERARRDAAALEPKPPSRRRRYPRRPMTLAMAGAPEPVAAVA
jgi:hypothetical protein